MISSIGKERKPLTAGSVGVTFIVICVLIYAIYWLTYLS